MQNNSSIHTFNGATSRSPYDVLETRADGWEKLQRINSSYNAFLPQTILNEIVWDAHFWKMAGSNLFQQLPAERSHLLLNQLARSTLQEAQLIEVAGIQYTAKMALAATTMEQRCLYSHFSGDEVRHLQMFNGLIGSPTVKAKVENGFVGYLEKIIMEQQPNALVLLIQVLLEGWGIRYYGTLAKNSKHEDVSKALDSILLDEGRHHGSGLVLFDENNFSETQLREVLDLASEFIEMVRMGPVSLTIQMSKSLGGMNKTNIERFLADISYAEKITSDLKLIAGLLTTAGANKTKMALEQRGMFEVPSLEHCASAIDRMLRACT